MAMEMRRTGMSVVLVLVFPLPIAFIPRFTLHPSALRLCIFYIVPVPVRV